jgi:hypothetical protein
MTRLHSRRQRGIALLSLMVVLVLSLSWIAVRALNAANSQGPERRALSGDALMRAKTALIGYAAQIAMTDESPGRLPCPEHPSYAGTSYEGYAENARPGDPNYLTNPLGTCTLPAIGRLPWRTLGTETLRDAYGEPLWYVLSAGFNRPDDGTTLRLNSDTPAQLTVDGISNAAVALLIAPGPAIAVQGCSTRQQQRDGTFSSVPDYRDYLDCDTAFVTNGSSAYFNDTVVLVSHADLFRPVEAVVAKRIETQVVPELLKTYNTYDANCSSPSATSWFWQDTSVSPQKACIGTVVDTYDRLVFPFAVPFENPATSTLRGSSSSLKAVSTYQGLLPLASSAVATSPVSTCTSTATAICWDVSQGVSATYKTGGTGSVSSTDCALSTSTQLSCTVMYTGSPVVALRGYARNMLNMFRRLDLSGIGGFAATPSISEATIFANAQVRMELRAQLPNAAVASTATVSAPISMFADHQLLDESNTTYGWFVRNRWHQLVYYAVAKQNSPNSSSTNRYDCQTLQTSPTPCLRLDPVDASSDGKQRALLVLAGRSLSSPSARPNATLSDYLELENAVQNSVFIKLSPNSTFNDRIVVISARSS